MACNLGNVLVTGGAGYIGSHTVRALQTQGFNPIVLDNFVYGHEYIVRDVLKVPFINGQLGDRELLENILSGQHPYCNNQKCIAVIHFAAYAYVGESVTSPKKYYRNNVGDSLVLLEVIHSLSQTNKSDPIPIVFSSTCATYGTPPGNSKISEDFPQNPINPYGRSKLMIENMINDFGCAYHMPSVIFRYFNAAGAHPECDLGEDHTPETHLVPLVIQTALGHSPEIHIYGDDYETVDGTCVRDYIHVCDLADAHVLGLKKVLKEKGQFIFNLGNGNGTSVLQVIKTCEQVTGLEIPSKVYPRRVGDPPALVSSSAKAYNELGWSPRFPAITDIIKHAFNWHQKQNKE
ncbi:UDP-glucose 4-epimerase GalE [Synechococcus sp. AH-224-G16]|nr:UDP-glucose 4-epimerase GalE [Synechococcus sp. AH-224-G16]